MQKHVELSTILLYQSNALILVAPDIHILYRRLQDLMPASAYYQSINAAASDNGSQAEASKEDSDLGEDAGRLVSPTMSL